MKINTKRLISTLTAVMMLMTMLPGFALGESDKKYTETLQPEGWTLVENEGGATLSYTKGGGVDLIEVDGYAFKDLDRDGQLDVFEDWRVDYKERSRDLAANGGLSLEFQMGMKMNPFSVGAPAFCQSLRLTRRPLHVIRAVSSAMPMSASMPTDPFEDALRNCLILWKLKPCFAIPL